VAIAKSVLQSNSPYHKTIKIAQKCKDKEDEWKKLPFLIIDANLQREEYIFNVNHDFRQMNARIRKKFHYKPDGRKDSSVLDSFDMQKPKMVIYLYQISLRIVNKFIRKVKSKN
jgi:hypothetical protein